MKLAPVWDFDAAQSVRKKGAWARLSTLFRATRDTSPLLAADLRPRPRASVAPRPTVRPSQFVSRVSVRSEQARPLAQAAVDAPRTSDGVAGSVYARVPAVPAAEPFPAQPAASISARPGPGGELRTGRGVRQPGPERAPHSRVVHDHSQQLAATPERAASTRRAGASSTTAPVRALAVAHAWANSVGTVELSCTSRGLFVDFVAVSSFRDGYVPYPVTCRQRLTVPYEKVARASLDASGLVHLGFDPSMTPFSRLSLAGLMRDRSFDQSSGYLRRQRVERTIGIAALLVWIPITIAIRMGAPLVSPVLAFAMGATASALLYALRRDISARWVLFGPQVERVREEFLSELRWRLAPGVVENDAVSAVPAPRVPEQASESDPGEVGGWRGLLVAAGVTAAVAALAIVLGKYFLLGPVAPVASAPEAWQVEQWTAAYAQSATQLAVVSASQTPSIVADPPVQLPPCMCERADSPLWQDGVPRMSVLSENRAGRTSLERPSVYPQIAVVNNSSEDLKDIVMVVDFLLGPGEGRKARVVGRQDLFWEGRLRPGKAVKWRVKGRGDDFAVTSYVTGMLGEKGIEPAAADAFFELSTTANTPSVRAHGAKMLAYLGDARARDVVEKLQSEGHEPLAETLGFVRDAAGPLRVCSVQATPIADRSDQVQVEACAHNVSDVTSRAPVLIVQTTRGGEVRETRWGLGPLAPHTGVRVQRTAHVAPADRPQEAGVGDLQVVIRTE